MECEKFHLLDSSPKPQEEDTNDEAPFCLCHLTCSSHHDFSSTPWTLFQISRHRSRPICRSLSDPCSDLPLSPSSFRCLLDPSSCHHPLPSPMIVFDSSRCCPSSRSWPSSDFPHSAVWSSCCSCFGLGVLLQPARAVHEDLGRTQEFDGVDCPDQ